MVEEYSYNGTETFKGSIECEYHYHEHIVRDNINDCFYYHDTIIEEWEITIDNITKTKKLKWRKKKS